MLSITVVGAGYVGLVSAACFAEFGFGVTCVDVQKDRIEALNHGAIPIFEPGLDRLVARNREAGRLSFECFTAESVAGADAVFLAVGTPSGPHDGEADLSYVFQAARMIAAHLKPGAVVVTKSTVVPGTNRQIRAVIEAERPKLKFSVVSNPEFLREGSAIEDFLSPDRVVVGHHDPRGRELMETLYAPLAEKGVPVVYTSLEDAELIKYAANAFLALKISFINEIADLCEAAGGDVDAVARAVGLDSRIGADFLRAGPGFGGSCFPKDTRALAAAGRRMKRRQRLIETVVSVNENRKRALAERVVETLGSCEGRTVAVLGLAFKPKTDDIREAPALTVIPALEEAGAHVRAYDPEASTADAPELRSVVRAGSAYEALDGADAVILLTEWDEFRSLDLKRVRRAMKGRFFFDFRNVFSRATMERAGFHYVSIGRSAVVPEAEDAIRSSEPQRVWVRERVAEDVLAEAAPNGVGASFRTAQ